tara:strand:+ start:91 stop:411 length:321 start_codon:yes stop_codon:yes gene_type:complete
MDIKTYLERLQTERGWSDDTRIDLLARFVEKDKSFVRLLEFLNGIVDFERKCDSAEFDIPQEKCPKCGESGNIENHDEPDEFGRLEVTCHSCGYQWNEPAKLESLG